MRVPLISPVAAVIYRLDVQGTWTVNPPGTPAQGYDPLLREPIIYDNPTTGARTSTRSELAAVTVPCQVETQTYEELRMVFEGAVPITTLVLVFHRQDLELLSLIDGTTRNCLLKTSDRIDHLERNGSPGTVVQSFSSPLYIYEVLPGSYGFGPEGHDLEIAYTTHRAALPYGTS